MMGTALRFHMNRQDDEAPLAVVLEHLFALTGAREAPAVAVVLITVRGSGVHMFQARADAWPDMIANARGQLPFGSYTYEVQIDGTIVRSGELDLQRRAV